MGCFMECSILKAIAMWNIIDLSRNTPFAVNFSSLQILNSTSLVFALQEKSSCCLFFFFFLLASVRLDFYFSEAYANASEKHHVPWQITIFFNVGKLLSSFHVKDHLAIYGCVGCVLPLRNHFNYACVCVA